MIRVLVLANSTAVRAGLARAVRSDARLEFVGEGTPHEAAALVAQTRPDVVLADGDSGPQDEGDRRKARVASVTLVDDDVSSTEIVAAIIAAAAGLIVSQPRSLARTPVVQPHTEALTPRERDVLEHLARGSGNKVIAAQLRISEHTVKFHVASIFSKLGVSSRTEAVSRGVQLGLLML